MTKDLGRQYEKRYFHETSVAVNHQILSISFKSLLLSWMWSQFVTELFIYMTIYHIYLHFLNKKCEIDEKPMYESWKTGMFTNSRCTLKPWTFTVSLLCHLRGWSRLRGWDCCNFVASVSLMMVQGNISFYTHFVCKRN